MKTHHDKYLFFLIFVFYITALITIYFLGISIGDSISYTTGGTYQFDKVKLRNYFDNPSIIMHIVGNILFNYFHQNVILLNSFLILILVAILYLFFNQIYQQSLKFIFLYLVISPSIVIHCLWFSKELFLIIFFTISLIRFKKIFNYKIFLDPIFLLSMIIIFVVKQYLFIVILLCYIFLFLEINLYKKLNLRIFIYSIISLIFIIIFYFTIQYIDLLILESHKHFNVIANTSRPDFFVNQYDVFKKIIFGIYLYFFGPMYNEITSISIFVTYIDKFFTSTLLIILLINGYLSLNKFNFYNFLFIFIIIFLVLTFIHYPQSVQNIGSGFRYKSMSLYVFVLFVIQTNELLRKK